jgi:hypothetical protein
MTEYRKPSPKTSKEYEKGWDGYGSKKIKVVVICIMHISINSIKNIALLLKIIMSSLYFDISDPLTI